MDLNLAIVTSVSILVFVFVVSFLRSIAQLNNDTLGYQMNLLSFGALFSAAIAAVRGLDFWPGYDLSAPISKGVALFALFALQSVSLLATVQVERMAVKSGAEANSMWAVRGASFGLATFAMFLFFGLNQYWML